MNLLTEVSVLQDKVNLLQAWIQLFLNAILLYQTAVTAIRSSNEPPQEYVAATP